MFPGPAKPERGLLLQTKTKAPVQKRNDGTKNRNEDTKERNNGTKKSEEGYHPGRKNSLKQLFL